MYLKVKPVQADSRDRDGPYASVSFVLWINGKEGSERFLRFEEGETVDISALLKPGHQMIVVQKVEKKHPWEGRSKCSGLSSEELTNEVVRYIHSHYRSSNISLKELAHRLGMSASCLSRAIKERTGFTFTDLVLRLRIEEMKRELRNSDKTVRDIVLDSGYLGVSNLIAKFKRMEGVTPGQYRKLHESGREAT
ncbi:helix-turn-helix domain-containing protein [Paenibacillus sp. GYB003]|uniref:helix-turn-helix domain-containing protein n=1 Tax=Paenibacillus sp. GYB003 TaxID=2994392 RepID=UPI002F96349D